MFSLALTPRPQPTVLLSTAMPVCGSMADRSVRGGEHAGSIPATPTKYAVLGSVTAAIAMNDRNATVAAVAKREGRTDN